MYKISIDDIENEKNKTYHIDFDDDIPEIKAHVKASIDLISLGDFIEAKGKIKGIIKLECDLCLKEYDYKLDFSINEMYAKNSLFDEPKQETELKEANTMYMALELPKGDHEIHLVYCTPYLRTGLCLTCIGVLCYIVLVLINRKKKRF